MLLAGVSPEAVGAKAEAVEAEAEAAGVRTATETGARAEAPPTAEALTVEEVKAARAPVAVLVVVFLAVTWAQQRQQVVCWEDMVNVLLHRVI